MTKAVNISIFKCKKFKKNLANNLTNYKMFLVLRNVTKHMALKNISKNTLERNDCNKITI